jgi:hypothetical protein
VCVLFSPISLRSLTLPNRIIVSPMRHAATAILIMRIATLVLAVAPSADGPSHSRSFATAGNFRWRD